MPTDGEYRPQRAMVIVAHPDDAEFGCAGTIARWAAGGTRVSYVLCTSGDVGIAEPGMTRAKATEIREAEQRAAASMLGVTDVVFLREPDGTLVNSLDLRKKLVREIRRFKPEAVITFDPLALWVGDAYINHPDHRAAATAAVDAVFPAAGQPLVFEELASEGLTPHKVRKVFVLSFDEAGPRTVVDVSATIEAKIAALRAHASQFGDRDPADMVREWAKMAAKDQPFEYGESFRVVSLISDEDYARLATGDDPP
jgi:LmbE family N-acetylglucosaminyl deacetylase